MNWKNRRKYFHISFIILATISCILITIEVIRTEIPWIDKRSAPLVAELDDTRLFYAFRWITELGSGTFITPFTIIIALFILWYAKEWLAPLMIAVGTLLGYQLNYWVKHLIERERPRILVEAEGIGYSFPSGHAMGAMIAYGLYVYFLTKYTRSKQAVIWINIVGICLIVLIGISRYVIRVHYLTDVLGGYAFGYLFLIAWIGVYHLVASLMQNKKNPSRSRD